jgi:tyrosyl-tRNA synthetase
MEPLEILQQNVVDLHTEEDLKKKLAEGRPLRIKLGVDPTRPDLTFGHMVVFNKLRQFQDLGHEAILIIGDFTTLIGDPSGRSSTRPVLTKEEIQANAETYVEQAYKILDAEKTTVRYNSEWFGEMGFEDCLQLARRMTVARMLERDDFSKRYAAQTPISIIEFLYPLVQGQDSVEIHADLEIGGSDQLFNCLVGRQLQKDVGQDPQVVLTLPLLVGTDGVKKMSKSQDNYIAFNDAPKEMFGKIMSISDEVMWDYYRLLLLKTPDEIAALQAGHPMTNKKALASGTHRAHPRQRIGST